MTWCRLSMWELETTVANTWGNEPKLTIFKWLETTNQDIHFPTEYAQIPVLFIPKKSPTSRAPYRGNWIILISPSSYMCNWDCIFLVEVDGDEWILKTSPWRVLNPQFQYPWWFCGVGLIWRICLSLWCFFFCVGKGSFVEMKRNWHFSGRRAVGHDLPWNEWTCFVCVWVFGSTGMPPCGMYSSTQFVCCNLMQSCMMR